MGKTNVEQVVNIAAKVIFWIIAIFILFAQLDYLPIILWDEARLAVSAYEMSKSTNPLVVTYTNIPEFWSVKPPLLIWIQALFIKALGYNEIALRLPSALAGLGTVLLLFRFAKKYFQSPIIPYLVAGILLTTPGYISIHGTRTADYDAMFILWNTLYCLAYFTYLEKKNLNYLFVFFLGLFLAVMTKSIAGFICVPALFLYTLYKKELGNVLKNKYIYLGIVLTISAIVTYYFFREKSSPGYLDLVMKEELFGRISGSIQEDKEPWWFYLELMFRRDYMFWFPLLLVSIGLMPIITDIKTKSALIFALMCGGFYLLIMTLAGTKLEWYEMPIYPFLAIVTGCGIYFILAMISNFEVFPSDRYKYWFSGLVILLISFYAIKLVYKNVFYTPLPPHGENTYQISLFLRDQLKNQTLPPNTKIIHEGYDAGIIYYKYAFQEKGLDLVGMSKDSLKSEDIVLVHEPHVENHIRDNFELEQLQHHKNIKVLKILSQKKIED